MKKAALLVIALIVFSSAQSEFGNGNLKFIVQPSYIIKIDSSMFTSSICTTKVGSIRVDCKAIRCRPKCDTGLVVEINPKDNPADDWVFEKLEPGYWKPIIFGRIRSTNTTIDLDSLECAVY